MRPGQRPDSAQMPCPLRPHFPSATNESRRTIASPVAPLYYQEMASLPTTTALWTTFATFIAVAMIVVVGFHNGWSAEAWAALALPAVLLPSLLSATIEKIALNLSHTRSVDSGGAGALDPPQEVVDHQLMEVGEVSAGCGQNRPLCDGSPAFGPVASDSPAHRGSPGDPKSSAPNSDPSQIDRRGPVRPASSGRRLDWTPEMQEILSVLASELPQIGDMENCASQAGVSVSRVRWGNRPDNVWQELLERASAQSRPPGCLQALLDAASRKSPEVERVVTWYRSSDEHAS